eukprot:RCo012309
MGHKAQAAPFVGLQAGPPETGFPSACQTGCVRMVESLRCLPVGSRCARRLSSSSCASVGLVPSPSPPLFCCVHPRPSPPPPSFVAGSPAHRSRWVSWFFWGCALFPASHYFLPSLLCPVLHVLA